MRVSSRLAASRCARSRATQARSAAGKYRGALFHEGPRGFLVVVGPPGFDLMLGLEVKQLRKRTALGRIEMSLHQAERDARTFCQPPCESHGRIDEIAVRHDLVDDSQGQGLRGIERF